jgi:hypothetical protein
LLLPFVSSCHRLLPVLWLLLRTCPTMTSWWLLLLFVLVLTPLLRSALVVRARAHAEHECE